MKKNILSFAALLIISAFAVAVFAQPLAFTILDDSSFGLGTVTVTTATGASYVSVPAPGSYPASPAGAVTSVAINGQVVPYPTSANVVLANGAHVRVSWGSNNIEIIDEAIINSPVR